mmetsp:Transcript_129412/g.237988  ORF Transcript_129412/g.237988 Transcript_129412/m.237988 type:complete len:454 (+) Transcript_129412:86-1447(+)
MLSALDQPLSDGGTGDVKGESGASAANGSTGSADSTIAATCSTASEGCGSARAPWEDGSPAAFAPLAAELVPDVRSTDTRGHMVERASCDQDAWASQVLGSLRASAPERGSQRLDPELILQALGCQGSDCSSLSSTPLLGQSGVPAMGLRRPPSAAAMDAEVKAKVQLFRSAVPGLEMSKVRMGDVSDEDTEDEQALLLSELKPAPAALTLNPKIADVPQLNMLALTRGDLGEPAGSCQRGECNNPSTGSRSPWAPRRGSLRGSSSQPVLSLPEKVASAPRPPPRLQGSNAANAALLAGAARRGPGNCVSMTVGDWTGSVLPVERTTALAAPAVTHGTQLPPVDTPARRSTLGTLGSVPHAHGGNARPDRQARKRPLVAGSAGAVTRHSSLGALGRGSSVGSSAQAAGIISRGPRDRKAPIVSHINVHHHLHYHVMRPARAGPAAHKASEVLT